MHRIRLTWILPLVLMGLSETSLQMQRHPHPPVHGDIYWRSTFDLLCAGLSAPADHLSFIVYGWSSYRTGVFLGDIVYLVLVAILWYLVGSKIDSWRLNETRVQQKTSLYIVLNVLAALYGLYLLLFLALHNIASTAPRNGNGGTSNFVGDVIHQSLWLLWSLTLLVVPSFSLASAFKLRSPSPLTK